MKIELIMKNKDDRYSAVDAELTEEGLSIDADEIADIFAGGEEEAIDISGATKVDLGDGSRYGDIYVRGIDEGDKLYQVVEDVTQDAGAYLDNVTYSVLSETEATDWEDYSENINKQ